MLTITLSNVLECTEKAKMSLDWRKFAFFSSASSVPLSAVDPLEFALSSAKESGLKQLFNPLITHANLCVVTRGATTLLQSFYAFSRGRE